MQGQLTTTGGFTIMGADRYGTPWMFNIAGAGSPGGV